MAPKSASFSLIKTSPGADSFKDLRRREKLIDD